jgi:cell division protein FtsB
MAKRPRKRPTRSTIVLRWLALGAVALIAFLYYRPLHTYFSTRSALAQRSAEVSHLQAQHRELVGRLARSTSADALEREARRLGLIKPGERLFIVKGIRSWLRRQHHHASRIERHE